jgi:hypothetical protein
MKHNTLKIKIIFFSMFFLAFSGFESPLLSMSTWEEFSEVKDKRNFKEKQGGKTVPAQGRIIETSTKTLEISPRPISIEQGTYPPWNYVIAMNCRRGDRSPAEIVHHVTQLLPVEQHHRLGIIIGINEKVSIEHPVDYNPSWDEILGGKEVQESLRHYNVPIILVYYQWTSFWEHTLNKTLSASEVRQLMAAKLSHIRAERFIQTAKEKIRPVDETHQFPYGRARSHILGIPETHHFIAQFDSPRSEVYIHIQDSDFISFNETPKFAMFQNPDVDSLIPPEESYLLSKYDRIITEQRKRNGRLPIIVGGAHVYSPQENMSDYLQWHRKIALDTVACKEWTRFGSEMGNALKHIIGLQQPYGLYFHEPNTLILSPVSANRLYASEKSADWKAIYRKLAGGFQFGIDSELQDFTRKLFNGSSDSVCRMGMVFLATTILSTSMKRGKKPFTIQYSGTYDERSTKFIDCTQDCFKTLRGMSQEIMHPNKWMSTVATSFASHRNCCARKVLCGLFNIFEPLGKLNPRDAEHFRPFLVNYEEYLLRNQSTICDVFRSLISFYNKKNQGNAIAQNLISLSWECGQAMRLMLLDSLSNPEGIITHPQVGKIAREFLARRFNSLSAEPNPHATALLLHVPPVKELSALPILMRQQEQHGAPHLSSKPAGAKFLPQDVTFTEEKYAWLLGKIKNKIETGNLTYKQVTQWAGYSGDNGRRDFATMEKKTCREKEIKWANLIARLKETNLFEEFFSDKK